MGRHVYLPGHPKYVPPDPAKVAAKAKADAESDAEKAKEKRDKAVKWYVDVLGFPEPAANALYIEQTLTDTEILSKLTSKSIDNIYEAVRKRGGAGRGDPIPILAIERLKLAVFCLKLAVQTSRPIPDWEDIERCNLEAVADQKLMEEDYLSSKDSGPELKPMSLDVHSAPTCFDKVRVILAAMRGCTGIPLTYVIRLRLMPFSDLIENQFGQPESPFGSIDEELVVRAPIIVLGSTKNGKSDEELEEDGPFTSAFLTDMEKVYQVLHQLFGSTSAWQHVKKYQQAQAGQKTWHVLHAHFFGGDKATALYQQTLKRLSDLRYDGNSNPKTWSFDKYTTAHVAAHNTLHTLHVDYKVDAMPEALKIKYYQDGISDPFFNLVRLSIQSCPNLFSTFDQVKDQYTSFKRATSAFDNPGTTRRGILYFGQGGPGRGRGDGGRSGRGVNDPRPRKPMQEEIDACTHIKSKRYDTSEYKHFSPAEKAKHWQLMNPHKQAKGVDRGRGGGRKTAYDRRPDTDRTTIPSTISKASSKRCKYETKTDNDSDLFSPTGDKASISNRNNKALTRSSPSGRQPKREN
jgi:hypothetical protein